MRKRWTQTRIDYHPCLTSEATNQVCYSEEALEAFWGTEESPRFFCVIPGVWELCSQSFRNLVLASVRRWCSIGGWCYSGWWVWDLRTLVQFQGSQMLPGLFKDFMDGYIKFWGSFSLLVELQVPNLGDSQAAGSMRNEFLIPIFWNLCSESAGA